MARTDQQRNAESGRIEQTALVVYCLLEEMRPLLAVQDNAEKDDAHLGILMGLTMFLDEQIGPFRTERLMAAAPSIILQADAHVTPEQRASALSTLRRIGDHLVTLG
ncbi:hypothetical protein [Niveispirillum irakense]|uniref:hypothetical protein n=1 Tax=Niveispirillum irakense TaxID=34011 RepID=UPI00041074CF|nr:hypothetical protein [Niveispirillum irakense]